MIAVRLPTAASTDWWVVMHSLAVKDQRLRYVRPIHLLTLLGQCLVEFKRDTFGECLALENKLFGVAYFLEQLRGAISQIGDPIYTGTFVRDYRDHQRFICVLDSYLGALYSSLELAAQVNRRLHPGLPRGFRRQAKKHHAFSLDGRDWLKRLYDLRSQLQHFSTSMLSIGATPSVSVEFTDSARREFFEPGRHEVSFEELIAYARNLFDLLDAWAREELGRLDPDIEIDLAVEIKRDKHPRMEKVKVRDLLQVISDDDA